MNEQGVLDLSPPLPLAPKRAPRSTSAEALAGIAKSGKLGEQQRQVLAALVEHWGCFEGPWGGNTSQEVAKGSGVDRYVIARRLPELEAQGFVGRAEERLCDVTGHRAVAWRPTPAGLRAIREGLTW